MNPNGIADQWLHVLKCKGKQKTHKILTQTEVRKTADEKALERYQIISSVLIAMDEKSDKAKIGMLKVQACGKAGVSRKTLARWLERYAQKGMDGLKYRGSSERGKRLIPEALLKEA